MNSLLIVGLHFIIDGFLEPKNEELLKLRQVLSRLHQFLMLVEMATINCVIIIIITLWG